MVLDIDIMFMHTYPMSTCIVCLRYCQYYPCDNPCFAAGTVAGVYANYAGKERIRILVREQFSRFNPPVDKQYYT